MTVDVGLHLRPVDRLHLAAATHFLPPGLGATPATDYYLGAAFDVGPHRGRRGLGVTPRYGVTLHAEGGLDHHGGVGVRLGIPIEFNAMVSREAQGGDVIWRPAFAVHLRIGPYAIGATRGSGVRDIGATYRVVVDLAL